MAPILRPIDASWLDEDQETLRSTFGAKAVGLSRLPSAWVPPSLALSVGVCTVLRTDASKLRSELAKLHPEIQRWQEANKTGDSLILRSSASSETILDRGKFLTEELKHADLGTLEQAVSRICRHFIASGHFGEMALLIQPLLSRRAWGHAANIRRVSATRNHWEYEVEGTDRSIRLEIEQRFNTERRKLPENPVPLIGVTNQTGLHRALQLAGRWISTKIEPVVSVEWLLSGDRVWLVQCDDEVAHPQSIDPRTLALPPQAAQAAAFPDPFKLYVVGEDTPVRKLKLLQSFSPPGFSTSHAIHYAFGSQLENDLKNEAGIAQLGVKLNGAAPNGLVVRTACTDASRAKSMNLPRTDTVGGMEAARWIAKQLSMFADQGIAPDKCAFLAHRFIPARKAAWTYYAPGERRVRIDALWGLPDGIQYYAHDTYEFDVVTGLSDRPTIEFKAYVLWPSASGKWEKLHVSPEHGRKRCLSLNEIKQIGRHAEAISKSLGRPTQVMWFCDFPAGGEHAAPLPWYMEEVAVKPTAQSAAPPLPKVVITTKEDLKRLMPVIGGPRSRLILEPEPAAIRDPEFIDLTVQYAKQGSHVVVMEGSVLAHAFYQITSSGVPVRSLRGTGRQRTLRKREFGKLVRDKIPDVIAATGETAKFGPIPQFARKRLLIAKAIEELWELSKAEQAMEVEEVADLFEVISALLAELGLSWDAVEAEAERKRNKRGGFVQGLVLIGSGIPTTAPADDMLPASDDRKVPVSSIAAMEAASEMEITGDRLVVPFFSLLDPQAATIAKLGKSKNGPTIEVELEGDRLSIAVSVPSDASKTKENVDDDDQSKE